jgi:hypothetical protein
MWIVSERAHCQPLKHPCATLTERPVTWCTRAQLLHPTRPHHTSTRHRRTTPHHHKRPPPWSLPLPLAAAALIRRGDRASGGGGSSKRPATDSASPAPRARKRSLPLLLLASIRAPIGAGFAPRFGGGVLGGFCGRGRWRARIGARFPADGAAGDPAPFGVGLVLGFVEVGRKCGMRKPWDASGLRWF